MSGQDASVPAAGGNATLTSIGVPSQLGTMPLQKRWPDACVVQASEPPNTLGTAALAVAGQPNAVATTTAMSILRICRPPPKDPVGRLNHAPGARATGRTVSPRAAGR